MNADELAPLVAEWLPTQRWFADKGRDFVTSVRELAVLSTSPHRVSIWLAEVTSGSERSVYQLPLVERSEPEAGMEHVLLGTLTDGAGRPVWIYDALHDKRVTRLWLDGLRDNRTDGPLRFTRYGGDGDIPTDVTSLVLAAEQSNTSLIFGSDAILKVFRRLEAGHNPDIEVHAALAESGDRHVARLLGVLSAEVDGEHTDLAMLQEYLNTAVDGWQLAKISVRDLLAEADLHAEETGGDFAGEAERLGVATAELHADLLDAFGGSVLDRDARAERAALMTARFAAARADVPELSEFADAVAALYAEFAASSEPIATQRVHGDLHLGQALRTVTRWVVLDFEGEPASAMTSRGTLDSPLRDVAGMLRSFDYAARFPLLNTEASTQLIYRAGEWADRNRDAFRAGYAEAGGDLHDAAALRTFEVDKAVYEARYEVRNRPAWLPIPLESLRRIFTEGATR